jgi:SAM-dependent methyltransferase
MSDNIWYTRHPLLKQVYKAHKKVRRTFEDSLNQIYYRFNLARSHRALRKQLGAVENTYDKYLHEQLEETLRKRRLFGSVRHNVIPLIDMLSTKHDFKGESILCVGCRNDDEIKYFKYRGAGSVIGVDLYNAGPGILIMDMQDLKFPDSSFDVVYARHSFEHAYDKVKVGSGFVRVLKPGGVVVIEVPGRYKGGADYNYFDGVEDVLIAFEGHVDSFLWNEYSRKEENTDKMDIIRLMFRVKK